MTDPIFVKQPIESYYRMVLCHAKNVKIAIGFGLFQRPWTAHLGNYDYLW